MMSSGKSLLKAIFITAYCLGVLSLSECQSKIDKYELWEA